MEWTEGVRGVARSAPQWCILVHGQIEEKGKRKASEESHRKIRAGFRELYA
jgi:hypothetical protein